MQIIIIPAHHKEHKHWHLTRPRLLALMLVLLSAISATAFGLTTWLKGEPEAEQITSPAFAQNQMTFNAVEDAHHSLIDESTVQGFYAEQLGGLQAEAARLRMLSQRLAEIAGFDSAELAMFETTGQGGIEQDAEWMSHEEFEMSLSRLSDEFAQQQDTLSSLQDYLITNDSIVGAIPSGRPVGEDGWVSSFFGQRADPFTGKKAFHSGLDYAGRAGSTVHAVADGIVSWAGLKGGYGGLVEIDHGNGYVTRYAHNKELKVTTGDRVKKGDVLALMGSTGRSTGPHVHYEILRDGQPVNPANYLE